MSRKYEYINISTPKIRAKPAPSHGLQLLRTWRSLMHGRWPNPDRGHRMDCLTPKSKLIPSQSAAAPAQASFELKDELTMKLSQMATIAALAAGITACEPSSEVAAKPSPSIIQSNSHLPPVVMEASPHTPLLATKELRSACVDENELDELKSFIPSGAHNLAVAHGDINSDGRQDAVLVIDYPGTGNEKLGEGLPRSLLLLVRDDSGSLQKTGENNKLIPCAACGGVWGDPFGSIHVENNSFRLVVEGGSRWHWSDEYTFRYDARRKDWFPRKIRKAVVDRLTTEVKVLELNENKAPNVSFSTFDPTTLLFVEM